MKRADCNVGEISRTCCIEPRGNVPLLDNLTVGLARLLLCLSHVETRTLILATAFVGLALTGCDRPDPPHWPVSSPAELCDDETLGPDDFCMPSARMERWLRAGHFKITHAALTASGVTAPHKLRLEITSGDGKGLSFNAKFKPVPDELDEFNNSPRRELAAYEAQKLMLDAEDYVVPPTTLYCINLGQYRDLLTDAEPFGDTGCTLGVLAYWVENVTDENVLDEERFDRDRRYRYYMGNLNAFTVFIGHEDSLGKNILISKDATMPKVLTVDNGLAFDAWGANPFRFMARKWKRMQVDAIPAKTVKRLKRLQGGDIQTLGVVAQIELLRGTIAHVPKTKPLNPESGVRRHGRLIQFGLTSEELTEMHGQLAKLLASLHDGDVKPSGPPPMSRRQ